MIFVDDLFTIHLHKHELLVFYVLKHEMECDFFYYIATVTMQQYL